jgi:hypothetical protein
MAAFLTEDEGRKTAVIRLSPNANRIYTTYAVAYQM